MPYREYPRVSETAAILRFYAANTEAGEMAAPLHIAPVDQVVGILRLVAMTFDKEVADQEGEPMRAPEVEAIGRAQDRFAQLVMKRRNANLPDDSDSGGQGRAGAGLVMRWGPGYRRRRAP